MSQQGLSGSGIPMQGPDCAHIQTWPLHPHPAVYGLRPPAGRKGGGKSSRMKEGGTLQRSSPFSGSPTRRRPHPNADITRARGETARVLGSLLTLLPGASPPTLMP